MALSEQTQGWLSNSTNQRSPEQSGDLFNLFKPIGLNKYTPFCAFDGFIIMDIRHKNNRNSKQNKAQNTVKIYKAKKS